MSRVLKVFILILIIILVFSLYLGCILAQRAIYTDTGDALTAKGRYTEASVWYRRINDTAKLEACLARIDNDSYQQAVDAMRSGRYDMAGRILRRLGAYRDSAALAQDCDYLMARELTESGRYGEAVTRLLCCGAGPRTGAELARTTEQMYQRAITLAYEFRLESAAKLLEPLGNYKNSLCLKQHYGKLLAMSEDKTAQKLLVPEKIYEVHETVTMYTCDCGYLVVPDECNSETRFLLYYPGGREQKISLDFVAYYLMNPPPNTIALFLYTNGLSDMEKMNTKALDTLDRAAMEREVLVHNLVLCGSSLGVYPTLYSIIYSYEYYGESPRCAILLDAGSDWSEYSLLMRKEDYLRTAAIGTDIYAFEQPGVGMNRTAIRMMTECGNDVTVVACMNDDHEAITNDALGMGLMDWALGSREKPYESDIYSFIKLTPDSTYPY